MQKQSVDACRKRSVAAESKCGCGKRSVAAESEVSRCGCGDTDISAGDFSGGRGEVQSIGCWDEVAGPSGPRHHNL